MLGMNVDITTTEDFYERILKLTLESLKMTAENPEKQKEKEIAEEILKEIIDQKPRALRNLVKKPAMTKAYSASYLTSYSYIKEELKNIGVTLSKQALDILVKTIIMSITMTIRNEIQLIKTLQKRVAHHNDRIT
jgi:hypothetical protein